MSRRSKSHVFEHRPETWQNERAGHITSETVRGFIYQWGSFDYTRKVALEVVLGRALPSGKLKPEVVHTICRIPRAIDLYQKETGNEVDTTLRFIKHPDKPYLGVTPDGLVGDDGMIEVYAPNSHMGKQKRTDRIQFMLACTGRQWCDEIAILSGASHPKSEDPNAEIRCTRIYRDNPAIIEMLLKLNPHIHGIQYLVDEVKQHIISDYMNLRTSQ